MVTVSSSSVFDEDKMDERLLITHCVSIIEDSHIKGEAHQKGETIFIVRLEQDGVPFSSKVEVPYDFRRRLRQFLSGYRPEKEIVYDLAKDY